MERFLRLVGVTLAALVIAGCGEDGSTSAAGDVEAALADAYATKDATLLRPILADDVTFTDVTFSDEVAGAEDVEQFIRVWMSTWSEAYTPEFIASADGTRLVEVGVWTGSGPSGEFSTDIVGVSEIVDDKIESITVYYAGTDLPESVEAVFETG